MAFFSKKTLPSSYNEQNLHHIKKVTWIGLLTNIALAIFKFVLGYLGKSSAVIADAVHSLSDLATDLVILIGVGFWSKPADTTHPYGHKRIETLITILLGFILVITAMGIAYNGFSSIYTHKAARPLKLALFAPLITILIKEALFWLTKITAKKCQSEALMANAWHHRSDAFSSLPVLITVGIASVYPKLAFLDSIGAIIVAVFILKVSFDIMWPRITELTDTSISKAEINKIKDITKAIPGVKSLHEVRSRKHCEQIYVDLHVLVAPELSVKKGHDIASNVKHTLMSHIKNLADVVVHIEPFEEEDISHISKK